MQNNHQFIIIFKKFNRCIESSDGKFIYYFGIIDIFTSFKFFFFLIKNLLKFLFRSYAKKLEYIVKKLAFGPTISAIPPINYANRFVSFIQNLIEVKEEEKNI